MKIAAVDSATLRLMLTLIFEFEHEVGVRFDFLSVPEIDEYPEAVLA